MRFWKSEWHLACSKICKSSLKKISCGSTYLEGKTWSSQLDDKVEPVATHFHWAIRNCEENPEKLQALLLNIVQHYKNNHDSCHSTSRCRKDPNYKISRKVLTDPRAEKVLLGVIKNSVVFKNPQDYRLCRDTYYVESFNNVVNVYQDKRISFSDDQYNARANLAVCHWNENVDREFTSVWKPNYRVPRSLKGKKNYKKCTYQFRKNIWKRYIKSAFRTRRNQANTWSTSWLLVFIFIPFQLQIFKLKNFGNQCYSVTVTVLHVIPILKVWNFTHYTTVLK